MGMFDYVEVDDMFKCLAGHSLERVEFQTKDLCEWPSLDRYWIKNKRFGGDKAGKEWGPQSPFSGEFDILGQCPECIVKTVIGVHEAYVSFRVTVADDVVMDVLRMQDETQTPMSTQEMYQEIRQAAIRMGMLERQINDPEGTIQRGINERYRRDMRERELEHHADWDAEVLVNKMAAARWMRGCAAKVADEQGFFAIGAAIEALPLVPES